jgi:NAD+ kinase
MECVGVIVHPTRPVGDALEVLKRWTQDRGVRLVQIPTGEQPLVAPSGEVTACGLITALGGDGTVLKALHAAGETQTPVLGVAYGSLGALTTVTEKELRTGLDRFAAGEWLARNLPALALRGGGQLARAINDLVLARRGSTQLVVDISVDQELYVRLAGDGIVVATPLGSSAYSMAGGGPLLAAVRLEIHSGHGGFYLEIDGLRVDTEAQRFSVRNQYAYATLVVLDDSRSGLPWLRERGLISDSPRVAARERRGLHAEHGS